MGAWLLAALLGGCAEPGPVEWTWVADQTDDYWGIGMASTEDGHLVVVRWTPPVSWIDLLGQDGETLWSNRLGGPDGEVRAGRPAVGEDGSIYVAGNFRGTVSFGDGASALSTGSCDHQWGDAPCWEGFLAAYDPMGTLRWVWRVPGAVEGGMGLATAAPGGIVVVGGFELPQEPAPDEVAPPAYDDFFVARLDAAGNELWRRWDLGPRVTAGPMDLVIDDDGSILLSVWYGDWEPMAAHFELVRLTADGEQVWRREADGGHLALTGDGDLIVASALNLFGLQRVGNYTMFVDRRDGASGELLWRSFLADWDLGQAYPTDLAVDPAGDAVIIGFINGPVRVGSSMLEPAGGTDLFVARLSGTNGQPLIGATSGTSAVSGGSALLALDRDDLVIAGHFVGPMLVGEETVIPPPDGSGVYVHRGDPFAQDE